MRRSKRIVKLNQSQVSEPLPISKDHVTAPTSLSQLMVPVMAQVGARRSAAQTRSQDKMDRVLRATAALPRRKRRRGAVTTTAVAARAEVSIGWLYNFFDDRQALLEEIVATGLLDPGCGGGKKWVSAWPPPEWRTRVIAGYRHRDRLSSTARQDSDRCGSPRTSPAACFRRTGYTMTPSPPTLRPASPRPGPTPRMSRWKSSRRSSSACSTRDSTSLTANNPAGDKVMLAEMSRGSVDYLGCFLL